MQVMNIYSALMFSSMYVKNFLFYVQLILVVVVLLVQYLYATARRITKLLGYAFSWLPFNSRRLQSYLEEKDIPGTAKESPRLHTHLYEIMSERHCGV